MFTGKGTKVTIPPANAQEAWAGSHAHEVELVENSPGGNTGDEGCQTLGRETGSLTRC